MDVKKIASHPVPAFNLATKEDEMRNAKLIPDGNGGYKLVNSQGEEVKIGANPLSISGSFLVGHILTAVFSNGWSATGYQWMRNGVAIVGATASTYTLVAADLGASVTCKASGLVYATTGQVVTETIAAPTIVSAPIINATPVVGTAISVTPAVFGGSASVVTTKILLNDAEIVGAGLNYIPITSDSGHALKVRQTAVNSAGNIVADSAVMTVMNQNHLRFASTRYKTSNVFSTHSGTNIYGLHESIFVSPDYPVTDPRFFLGAYACTGIIFPVDRYAEGQITYYGLAIKVGGTWYKITNSPDPAVGLDLTNGTKIGPLASATTVGTTTSSATTITSSVQPQLGDVLVFNNASTRSYAIVNTVVANGSNWDVTSTTYASGSNKYLTDTPAAIPAGTPCYIIRSPGLLTAPISCTIPANSTVRVQLLYAAPGSAAVPGQDFMTAGYVPALMKLDVERVVGHSSRTTTPAGCLASIDSMYGTDQLYNSSAPAHSGFYNSNSNLKRIHTPFFCVARGGDGRPVELISGDSIGYGSSDESMYIYDAYYSQGYLERGLNDATTSKRLSYAVIAEKGTSQDKMQDRRFWKPRLDMIALVAAANGGKQPFDMVIEESGSNGSGDVNCMSKMVSALTIMKADWGKPIIGVEILPKPNSATGLADGFQTLSNQAVSAAGTGYGTNGYIWQMNAAKADGGAWRTAGLLDGSFAPWTAVSYDTGANRDKVKIRQFTATLSSALAAGVYTYQLSVTAGAAPKVGEVMIIDPNGSTQEIVIETVTDNGGGSYTVTGYPTGFAATTAAASGAIVAISHLGQFGAGATGAAVHPSPWASEHLLKQTVVDWKISYGLGA